MLARIRLSAFGGVNYLSRGFSTTNAAAKAAGAAAAASRKRIAVVLAGSGVYDGSEITEAVSTLIHLGAGHHQVHMFAPDKLQMHTVNHLTGEEMPEKRNVLVESARIARGHVEALTKLQDANDFDALVIPGGFGVAKNLSSFAIDAESMKVDDEVVRVVESFHAAKKPIGLCCIAPTLAAKLIPGCELTVGMSTGSEDVWPYQGVAMVCETMGAVHFDTDIDGCHKDTLNKLVTSCAYMKNASAAEVHASVGRMIAGVLELA